MGILCNECFGNIDFIANGCVKCAEPLSKINIMNNDNYCNKCIIGRDDWFINECNSLFIYNKSGKNLIVKMKESDCEFLRDKIIQLAIRQNEKFFQNVDFIIPIPLHWLKKLIRGFDQSQLIAFSLSKLIKKPVLLRTIVRKKYTKSQHKKSYFDRFHNVKNSFFIKNCDIIKEKNVLLVDDVITSGATSNQCAKLLRQHSAKSIKLFTIARTILSEKEHDN